MLRLLTIGALGILMGPWGDAWGADAQDPNRPRAKDRPPNVVLIVTDDQGYGDLGCHGNPELKTPALDALSAESARLTNFHVDPTCSPTRAALMTGRYSTRTGVWHTIAGRSLMRKEEVTLAELFAAAGYRTGLFGKWHLGDNAPLRPQDRGFDEVLAHGGGGVGQTPDFWGNDYFDDTYRRNGEPEKHTGYCTDVWFAEATRFIEANRQRPFFAYLATNAPHAPYFVDEKYRRPYREARIPSPRAEFYGMIANIDENVGRLRATLDDLGLAENTLLIFMTDNGTAAGIDGQGGFNAGMRGRKGSEYDGGHRVPCLLHWPAGGLDRERDIDALTAHIDLLPTLAGLCGLSLPRDVALDGRSLRPLLFSPSSADEKLASEFAGRTLFVHSQRVERPIKWRKSAVMTARWRLVNGTELYDIVADPGQQTNVATAHPAIVAKLRTAYDAWWESLSPRFEEVVRIELGSEAENPTTLTCHDWHAPQERVPWNQAIIARDPAANGEWAVEIIRDGRYEFTLRCRPEGVRAPLVAGRAELHVGDRRTAQNVPAGAEEATFLVELAKGPATLRTKLPAAEAMARGAYYVRVRRMD